MPIPDPPFDRQQILAMGMEDWQDGCVKYAVDVDACWEDNVRRAEMLGLMATQQHYVLDLGAGFGFFGAATGLKDHVVFSLDCDRPIIRRAAEIIGGRRIWGKIEDAISGNLWPDAPISLVTMWQVISGDVWNIGLLTSSIAAVLLRLPNDGRFVIGWNETPADCDLHRSTSYVMGQLAKIFAVENHEGLAMKTGTYKMSIIRRQRN